MGQATHHSNKAMITPLETSFERGVVRTPFRTYWREFRFACLPPMFFGVLVAGIALLWNRAATGSGIGGIGVGPQSLVTAPQSGRIDQAMVEPFQWVEAGAPLLVLRPQDPDLDLNLLQSEMNLAQLKLQPTPAEGNALDFERLRMDWLRTKSELAVARAYLQKAEAEVRRQEPLHRQGLVSGTDFDVSLALRDGLQSEVEEKSATVDIVKGRLEALESIGVPGAGDAGGAGGGSTGWQDLQAELDRQRRPLILTAPMSGLVHMFHRQPGEHVTQGEPLISILSPRAEHIIGYLRQPYPAEPRTGAWARVTTRGVPSLTFHARISGIGAQVEVITNALAIVREGALVDVGLPIRIPVPDHVALRPGELVNLRLVDGTNGMGWPALHSLLGTQHAAATQPARHP